MAKNKGKGKDPTEAQHDQLGEEIANKIDQEILKGTGDGVSAPPNETGTFSPNSQSIQTDNVSTQDNVERPMPGPGAQVGIIFQRTGNETWEVILSKIRTHIYKVCLDKGVDIEADDFNMLTLKLGCGCKAVYKRFRDVPLEDTPCKCGASWLVKYIERIPCEKCKGSGKESLYQGVINRNCQACGGTGIVKETHAIRGEHGISASDDAGNRGTGQVDSSPGSDSIPGESKQSEKRTPRRSPDGKFI